MSAIPSFETVSRSPVLPLRWRDPYQAEPWAERIQKLLILTGKKDEKEIEKWRLAYFAGDPVADRLIAWMHGIGMRRGWSDFDLALSEGIERVENPSEELKEFFAEVDAVPDWLDRDALRRACRFGLRGALHTQFTEFSALLGGYAIAGLAKPLVATRALDDVAAKRVAETVKFIRDVFISEGLGRYSVGFKTTIRVRILHALVRHNLLKQDWDTYHWGIPLNQSDSVATLLGFSVASMMNRRALGCIITPSEGRDFMLLWRYVGNLLGIEDRLIPKTEWEGLKLLPLLTASQEGPDAESLKLAKSLLDTVYTEWPRTFLGRILARCEISFRVAITRYLFGNTHADSLDLPKVYLWRPIPLLVVTPLLLLSEVIRFLLPGGSYLAYRYGDRWLAKDVKHKMRALGKDKPVYEHGKTHDKALDQSQPQQKASGCPFHGKA